MFPTYPVATRTPGNLTKLISTNVNRYSNLVKSERIGREDDNNAEPCAEHFNTRPPAFFSAFALWLMLDKDRLGYGEITTVKCNQRSPLQSEFMKKKVRYGNKLPDELIRAASDRRDRQFLQNGEIEAIPYSIKQCLENEPKMRYVSVGRFTFKSRPEGENEAVLHHTTGLEVSNAKSSSVVLREFSHRPLTQTVNESIH
jgi:hypothetical protein